MLQVFFWYFSRWSWAHEVFLLSCYFPQTRRYESLAFILPCWGLPVVTDAVLTLWSFSVSWRCQSQRFWCKYDSSVFKFIFLVIFCVCKVQQCQLFLWLYLQQATNIENHLWNWNPLPALTWVIFPEECSQKSHKVLQKSCESLGQSNSSRKCV